MRSFRLSHIVVIALLGGMLLSACSSFAPEEPPIADTTLVRVLTEFHLASARAEVAPDSLPPLPRDSILAIYELNEAQLQAAIDYYADRPAAYETLYDAVLDSLNAYESELRRPFSTRSQ